MTDGSLGVMNGRGWRKTRRKFSARTLLNHRFHSSGRLRLLSLQRTGYYGVRNWVCRLQSGRQIHQPLNLNAVTGSHMRNVVEVRRRRDHFRTSIGIPVKNLILAILVGLKLCRGSNQTINLYHLAHFFWFVVDFQLATNQMNGMFRLVIFTCAVYLCI